MADGAAGSRQGVIDREPSRPRQRDRAFLHGDLIEVQGMGAAEYFERDAQGQHVVTRQGVHYVVDEGRIKRVAQRCGCRRDLDGPTAVCDLPYSHIGAHRWGEVR